MRAATARSLTHLKYRWKDGGRKQCRKRESKSFKLLGEIEYRPKGGVGFGRAVGARYPLNEAESFLLMIE